MSDSKYSYAIGRRKTAVAQVRLFKWKGESKINTKSVDTYITRSDLFHVIYAPLKVAGVFDSFHFDIKVAWSGPKGQAEAIRHGIARALTLVDAGTRQVLKWAGFLTRDARKVERKKPGLHKARKAPSWSKR